MPSIVPSIDNEDIHVVLNDYGPLGMSYVETDPTLADRKTIIRMLADGQFTNPVRVICINLAQGTAHDVSDSIAQVLVETGRIAPESRDFVRFHLGLLNAPETAPR